MMLKVLFLLVALGAVVGAIGMLSSPNPVHSALFLVWTLFCVAAVYLLLGAEFLAIVQVIVYAGAIMVLFLFIIMLLNLRRDEFGDDPLPGQWTWGLMFSALLAVALVSVAGTAVTLKFSGDPLTLTPIPEIARVMFTKYLLAVEIASLILLIAMVGVVVLAKRPKEGA
ncbi:NADH-quinone oxidoreductase subunit J [Fervidibacter sacchari]|jgi:NADH:ubiquinone oxidoreductase subunit 6 (chain J)|uniref:NADH-quinone oxidoreductase subunit J n=1 Tax=Candidatus Fervidibacter sacchari TaxID=1448929 RepID=A0ABT2EKM5_9BACT|nr:NADH-quinone oxidoreductase subunit J [Candidatus Fervidibacter sacchari]MCS3918481.1 NADH-quinone oxidoreductase subunit J [Candidatus Fervidibacter sacchari]WKU17750.1 NADH-quinone oxidoreductase subunit J [Candidatus Fervidibacter sacchari]